MGKIKQWLLVAWLTVKSIEIVPMTDETTEIVEIYEESASDESSADDFGLPCCRKL